MALLAADYLKNVADILNEYDETKESTNLTLAQTLITGVGTLAGAVMGELYLFLQSMF